MKTYVINVIGGGRSKIFVTSKIGKQEVTAHIIAPVLKSKGAEAVIYIAGEKQAVVVTGK